jgi:hypothetical protein
MPPKRAATKTTSPASPSSSQPMGTALLLGAAVSYAMGLLVMRGRVTWPPHELLASLYTVAGCLALVGPFVLARGDSGEGGLGELLWMAGGLLVWVFDAVAAARGQWRSASWATPLGAETMGQIMLAVLLAGWRCRVGGRAWSWTNVVGWTLGLFWVGMAVLALVSGRPPGVGPR